MIHHLLKLQYTDDLLVISKDNRPVLYLRLESALTNFVKADSKRKYKTGKNDKKNGITNITKDCPIYLYMHIQIQFPSTTHKMYEYITDTQILYV